MSSTNPISLNQEGSWPPLLPISAIRFDSAEQPEPLGAREDQYTTSAFPALGVLFEPGRSPVVFVLGRGSVLQGGSSLTVLSGETPGGAGPPSEWEELVSRVQAAIHSPRTPASATITSFGNIRVDFEGMEVTRRGQQARLTVQEFKTLKFFVSNPRRVISRDELLNEAWGYDNYPFTRTVDCHVLKLRQKLENDPANPVHFLTVHGAGYKFVP